MSSTNISDRGLNGAMQLKMLSFVINRIQEAVLVCDADGRICLVNLASCEELGYTEENLLQMSVTEVLTSLDTTQWQMDWQVLQHQQSMIRETHIRNSDATTIPVEIQANYFVDSGQQYCVLLIRNLSAHLEMLEKLREQELQFRQLVKNSPDIFIRYD